ncbi:MAG: hypothetical protein ACOYN3_05295, partial [Acidimicrobiia bacterium]
MGEARRKKQAGVETVPRSELAIDDYFRLVEPIDPADSAHFWSVLGHRRGKDYADSLWRSIDEQSRANEGSVDWSLLWSGLATAKATNLLVTPFARPWLNALVANAGHPASILDLACGDGFLTCFY